MDASHEDVQRLSKPRIVSFDIEVSPALGYFYPPTWETGILKVKNRQVLMSFAWGVVGETVKRRIDGEIRTVPKVKSLSLADTDTFKVDPHNDKLLSIKLHEVLSSADIILGQNSDQFDIKMANYFFIMNGLEPIPPAKYMDTKKIAKRYFRFLNNTLDNLGEELGVGKKTKTKVGDLWEDCFINNDVKAYKKLKIYNEQDVVVTTGIYLKMRPFMHSHPSLSRISGEWDSCPRCGSYSYRVKAYRSTDTSRYRQYQCNECHGFFSDRKAMTESQGDVKPIYKNV